MAAPPALLVLLILLPLSSLATPGLGFNGERGGGGVFHIQYPVGEEQEFAKGLADENDLPVPEIVRGYGYDCAEHHYTTEDGYINTLHRIPPTKKGKKGKERAVFLQHGLLGTSADYVMGRPDKSLGYMLADMGYDVWLGNARGNAYSRKHVNLTTDSDKYWRFSFDEMGRYDLPAAFAYVRAHQKASDKDRKLLYVGHSMGTIMFWVASSEASAEVEKAVEAAVAMGPVATVAHMVSPIKYLSYLTEDIELLFEALGIREFSPASWVTELFDRVTCDNTMRQLKVCENVCFLLVGFDAKQTNMTLLPIILGHEPGGTSTQTVIHFAQEYRSGRFCKFDHGAAENLRRYNSTTPPAYDLSSVRTPVALMYLDNDWLADPKDVRVLLEGLPRLEEAYRVPNPDFNHIDFLWGLDAPELVYEKIFRYFEKYP